MAEFIDSGTQFIPDIWTEGDSGFAAYGKPVPYSRRDAALTAARSMGCDNTERTMFYIDRASTHIERDQPYRAMQELGMLVDLTGSYRLLATLLTA